MLKNYLKTAWRSLAANRLYSMINILGLAVGMAVSFLLLLYVHHEYSYDRFNTNSDRLFLSFKNQPGNGQIKTKPLSPEPLAAELKKDFPEIENVARTNFPENSLISYQDKHLKIPTIAADPALLDMFTIELVYGNRQDALSGSSAILLTQSAATALFGSSNPVGQTVRLNNEFPLTVKAVVKDLPSNSSLSFKAVISWGSFLFQRPWMKDAGWDIFNFSTYVQIKPGVSIDVVNAKIKDQLGKYDPNSKTTKLFLYPLTSLHLYNEFHNGVNTGGRIEYIRLFFMLAIGILLIACINFMNLSTARSERRAREVGVRKTMGARRYALILQFMTESMVLSALAFVLSLLFLLLLLPVFDRIIDIQLTLPYNDIRAWSMVLGITLFTGLMAGSYPAVFLSSFNPIKVLKGQLTTATAAVKPRQILVIGQFTFAIGLIVSSCFIYRQINFIKDRPVGYDRNGLVEIPADGKLSTLFGSFRQEAIAAGAVSDAAMTSGGITSNQTSTWGVIWPDQLPGEEKLPIDCMGVTWHFTATYGLKLIRGRDFDPGRPADSAAILLNEAAVTTMRLKDPLGREITWQGSKRTVIGVVQNFVWGSPYEPVKPAIIGFVKDWVGNIGLRLNPALPVSKSLAVIQGIYKKYNPNYPFEYSFTDESFAKKYSDEKQLGSLALGFTTLAIFISCLGLFGLAAFSAGRRKKELGIRKVLGASSASLWLQLSGEFLRLIGISFAIGSAISWYYIHQWLSGYTYHTAINGWVFVLTLLGSMTLCLLAVSGQAIRAAIANPVNSLRSE